MESLASSVADGGDGVARDRDIWREESLGRAGDRETHVICLLLSRARLGIYGKFALSFTKFLKMQTPNVKLLDTSFCDFLTNYKNTKSKCKTLGDALLCFFFEKKGVSCSAAYMDIGCWICDPSKDKFDCGTVSDWRECRKPRRVALGLRILEYLAQ
jgi:hypothetical protein